MRLRIGDKVRYSGRLVDYQPFTGVITNYWKSGICKGRYQVYFKDMVEYDQSLTCAAIDLVALEAYSDFAKESV